MEIESTIAGPLPRGSVADYHLDALPSDGDWARVAAAEEKIKAFATDIYFRQGWADIHQLWGPDCATPLSRLGLLAFKPDAVVGRRLRRTWKILEENGFQVRGVAPIRYTRRCSGELWRYNWNFATLDRIALSTMMYAATTSLLLIVEDLEPHLSVPGSVRLSALKGSAAAEKRDPHHLRSKLGSVQRLINFVHVADEPADVVRELGILLEPGARLDLLRQVWASDVDPWSVFDRHVRALELQYPAHDLDFWGALERCEKVQALGRPTRRRFEAAAANEGPKIRWSELTEALPPETAQIDPWDFICIGCWVLADERPGHPDLLPSVTPAEWLSRYPPLVTARSQTG